MKTLKIAFTGAPGAFRQVVLDGTRMILRDGQAQREVPDGTHEIHWFTIAPPVTKYTLKVTDPTSAKTCKAEDVSVGAAGWDAGVCQVTVS
jgi:hypothetical protein